MTPQASPSVHVVRYRPDGPLALTFFLLVLLAGAAALLMAAGVLVRTTHVRCEHTAGVCAIVASWGPLTSTTTVPIASIAEARLVTTRQRRQNQYAIVLILKDGRELPLSNASSTDSARTLVQKDLAGFFADPGGHREDAIDVTYESWSPLAVFPFVFALVLPYIGWTLLDSAEVWVDGSRLRVTKRRWPLAPTEASFALPSVHGARVTVWLYRGKKYTVVLDTAGDKEFLLVNRASSARGPSERAVREIQLLLSGARDGHEPSRAR